MTGLMSISSTQQFLPGSPYPTNARVNLSDVNTSQELIVNLAANETSVVKQISGAALENVAQVWFTGYYVDGLSQPDIKVKIDCPGFRMKHVITTDGRGDAGVFITEPGTLASPVRAHLPIPIPLFEGNTNSGTMTRLSIQVRGQNEATPTFTRIQLFFAVVQQCYKLDPFSNAANLPTNRHIQSGYNNF